MRPYNIPLTNVWVDLDTIQSINEPALGKYDNCILTWQHAFRNEPSSVNFGRDTQPGKDFSAKTLREFDAERARLEKEWLANGTRRYYEKVFVPFFTAWAGHPPSETKGQ